MSMTRQPLLSLAVICSLQTAAGSVDAQPIEALSPQTSDNAYLCAQSLATSEPLRLRYSWVVATGDLALTDTQKATLDDAIDRADGSIGDEPVPTPTGADQPTIPELARQEIAELLKPLNLRVILKRGARLLATCTPKPKGLQPSQFTSFDQNGVGTTTSNLFLPVGSPATRASHRCKSPSGKLIVPSPQTGDKFLLVQRGSSIIRKASFKRCPDSGCRTSFFCGADSVVR